MLKTEVYLMEDHTVTLNGVDLHYRTIGDGPVLFLVPPGWGVASGYLQRAFTSLAKHLGLVFIDTRGSGLSGRPADPARMGSVDMAGLRPLVPVRRGPKYHERAENKNQQRQDDKRVRTTKS